jgi:hypothetical protein
MVARKVVLLVVWLASRMVVPLVDKTVDSMVFELESSKVVRKVV